MARPQFFIKQDRRLFSSALTQAGEICTKEQIANLCALHKKALEAQRWLERAPMEYANGIGASDKLCRARQNVRCLILALSMAKDAAAGMSSDISDAFKINDKAEDAEIEAIVEDEKKEAKKAYDRKRYLKKKKEAENE